MSSEDVSWLVDVLQGMFALDTWSKPLSAFVDSECAAFEDSTEEIPGALSNVHNRFRELVEGLLESHLNSIGLSGEAFASLAASAAPNSELRHLIDTQILAVDDFLMFKRVMIARNQALNREALAAWERQQQVLGRSGREWRAPPPPSSSSSSAAAAAAASSPPPAQALDSGGRGALAAAADLRSEQATASAIAALNAATVTAVSTLDAAVRNAREAEAAALAAVEAAAAAAKLASDAAAAAAAASVVSPGTQSVPTAAAAAAAQTIPMPAAAAAAQTIPMPAAAGPQTTPELWHGSQSAAISVASPPPSSDIPEKLAGGPAASESGSSSSIKRLSQVPSAAPPALASAIASVAGNSRFSVGLSRHDSEEDAARERQAREMRQKALASMPPPPPPEPAAAAEEEVFEAEEEARNVASRARTRQVQSGRLPALAAGAQASPALNTAPARAHVSSPANTFDVDIFSEMSALADAAPPPAGAAAETPASRAAHLRAMRDAIVAKQRAEAEAAAAATAPPPAASPATAARTAAAAAAVVEGSKESAAAALRRETLERVKKAGLATSSAV
jgi:hypothetical protein